MLDIAGANPDFPDSDHEPIKSMPERATAAPFPATRWSVVLSAREGGGTARGRAAMEDLCRLYWRPLYAFARAHGCSPEDAEDRTQDFFTRVAGGEDFFAIAQPHLGKLRTYLLAVFQRDLRDARRASLRQKRGSGRLVSFDTAEVERQLAPALLASAGEPLRLFEREWAESVIRASLEQLAGEFEAEGKGALFPLLRPFLGGEAEPAAGYAELSETTGLSKPAIRQTVHRLRERFRATMRIHVAETLIAPTEDQIDTEIMALRRALVG